MRRSNNGSDLLDNYTDLIRKKEFKDKDVLDLCDELGKSLRENTNNQVRKFYAGLRTIARKAKIDQVNIYILLTLYKSRVMYSKARNDKRRGSGIDNQFKTFLVNSINVILGKKSGEQVQSLQDFVEYFEAVYGYYYSYTSPENR